MLSDKCVSMIIAHMTSVNVTHHGTSKKEFLYNCLNDRRGRVKQSFYMDMSCHANKACFTIILYFISTSELAKPTRCHYWRTWLMIGTFESYCCLSHFFDAYFDFKCMSNTHNMFDRVDDSRMISTTL